MEILVLCKLAVLFLLTAGLGCTAVYKAYVDLWLLFFYVGLMVLPFAFALAMLGYPLVPGFLLRDAIVLWWGHLTGGLLALYCFGEHLGHPPRR